MKGEHDKDDRYVELDPLTQGIGWAVFIICAIGLGLLLWAVL